MSIRQRCIVQPTALAVSLVDAKKNLRVDGDELDDQITVWVQGITANLEHEIGQRLMRQTWEVIIDAFPAMKRDCIGWRYVDYVYDPIELPHPVLAIESVRYVDRQGVARTLTPEDYTLHRASYRSALVPTSISGWPAADSGGVVVTVQCGYGDAPTDVPVTIRLYILAKLVEQFDPATRTERDTVQSSFIDRLLDACRSYN